MQGAFLEIELSRTDRIFKKAARQKFGGLFASLLSCTRGHPASYQFCMSIFTVFP